MKQRVLIARQLRKIAAQITKQEEKKQQNVIKKVYKKVKDLLKTKSLFKHKIKDKIIKMVVSLIEQLHEQDMLTQQEVKELKLRLTGKKTASMKTAGKKGFIFLLIVSLINLFMPLIAFCNTVPEAKQQSIKSLLNSQIQCMTYSRKDLKGYKVWDIDNAKSREDKIELQKTLHEAEVYDFQQMKDTDVNKIAVDFKADDEIFSYCFVYRTKKGTKEIIKPNKMSDKDFKKMITIIGIFDKDNATGLRGQIDNKTIQEFINYNKKLIDSGTSFILITEKDTLDNDEAEYNAYQEIIQKIQQ